MAHITTERGSRPTSGRYIYQDEMNALVGRIKGRRQKNDFTEDELHENVNILARCHSPSEWMDVHNTIITFVYKIHGHTTLHQTTAFLVSFHNIDDELLISGFQKMIDGNEFSIEEICAMLTKMLMIRKKLLSENKERIKYYGNKRITKYYEILHQREIYNNIIGNIADRCNFIDVHQQLIILERSSSGLSEEYISLIFNINLEDDVQDESVFFSRVDKCLEFVKFMIGGNTLHWSDAGATGLSDDDVMFVVKKLCQGNMNYGNVHSRLRNRITKCPQNMLLSTFDNIQRILGVQTESMNYLIQNGIDRLENGINGITTEYVTAAINVAVFYNDFKEEVVEIVEFELLNAVPSPTGDRVDIQQKAIIRKILWKLSSMRTFSDRHFDLIGRIIGCVNYANVDRWIGKVSDLRPQLVGQIRDDIEDPDNTLHSMKRVVFYGYICYQFDRDKTLSNNEMRVIKDIFDIFTSRGSDVIVEGEENGLKKLLTDTFSQYIVDRFYYLLRGEKLFHNALIFLSNKDVLTLAVDNVLKSEFAKLLDTKQIEPPEE